MTKNSFFVYFIGSCSFYALRLDFFFKSKVIHYSQHWLVCLHIFVVVTTQL